MLGQTPPFYRGLWLFELKNHLKLKASLWLSFLREGLSLRELYVFSKGEKTYEQKYKEMFSLYPSILEEIRNLKHHQKVEEQISKLSFDLKYYDYIDYSDSDYPEGLKELPNAPLGLFTLSKEQDFRTLIQLNIVSVVGSRKASAYGLGLCEDLVKHLLKKKVLVMSGMALGIDTKAHQTCLKYQAPTLAILAHGFEYLYPPENKALFEQILEKGVLVTEYPPFEAPQRYKFRERNRMMSGLSQAVFIPEASEKSGTLLTATYASEQGREVYVCPSSFYSVNAKGAHQLIQEGANILYDFEQLEILFEEKIEQHLIFDEARNLNQMKKTSSSSNEIQLQCFDDQVLLEKAKRYSSVLNVLMEEERPLNVLLNFVQPEESPAFKSFLNQMLFRQYLVKRKNLYFFSSKGKEFMKFYKNNFS